jgi:hypothetical protein
MKWESDICEVNGSSSDPRNIETREVIFMWWEIGPTWIPQWWGLYSYSLEVDKIKS